MKESQLYINFFRRNLLIILTPIIVFLGLAFYYLQSLPQTFQYGQLFELNYTDQNASMKISQADEVVTLLRSRGLQSQLGVQPFALTIYKPGPVAIKVVSSSETSLASQKDISLVSSYLKQNYDLKEIGQLEFSQIYPNYLLVYLKALGVGVLVGLLVSLTKEYFQKF